jgi:hypothetical protein
MLLVKEGMYQDLLKNRKGLKKEKGLRAKLFLP